MCKVSKPKIQQEAPAEKPRAPFVTPDQMAGQGMSANMNAARAGRNSLRIDRGSDPAMAGVTPVENDQVRDFAAEEQAAKDASTLAAGQAAANAKRKKKNRYGKIQRVFDPAGGSIIANVNAIK